MTNPHGDLCEVCNDNLVVEGEDLCRACLTELEAEVWALERVARDPKHPEHHAVHADVWDARDCA